MYMVVSERSAVANRLSYQPVNRLEMGCKEAGITAEAVREYVTAYMASGRSLLETAIDLARDWRMETSRARRLVQLAYVGS